MLSQSLCAWQFGMHGHQVLRPDQSASVSEFSQRVTVFHDVSCSLWLRARACGAIQMFARYPGHVAR
eukprot:14421996-Alexandrium_andersonii.AAC.1